MSEIMKGDIEGFKNLQFFAMFLPTRGKTWLITGNIFTEKLSFFSIKIFGKRASNSFLLSVPCACE